MTSKFPHHKIRKKKQPNKKNATSIKPGQRLAAKPFDWELLDKLLSRKLSQMDCAELMKVDAGTIRRKITEEKGIPFKQYAEQKLAPTRVSLIEKALEHALKHNNVTMLIFCLKNICGWVDRWDKGANELVKNEPKLAQQIILNYALPNKKPETTTKDFIDGEVVKTKPND